MIANEIGGLPDYARPGESGWLNRSCTGEELARIMLYIAKNPEQVVELNRVLRSSSGAFVKPMDHHRGEMDELYREVASDRAAAVNRRPA